VGIYRTKVFPKWLNPVWVIGGLGAAGLLIVGMNLLLQRQIRLRTEALRESLAAQEKTASELRIAREIQMSFVPYFVLGDVSDKGVPAVLFMAVAQTLLGACALTAPSPAAIVTRVNRQKTMQPQIRKAFEIIQCEITRELEHHLPARGRGRE